MWCIVWHKLGETVRFDKVEYETYQEAEQRAVDLNRVESYLPSDLRRKYYAVPVGSTYKG